MNKITNDQTKLVHHPKRNEITELIYTFLAEKAKSTQKVYQGHLKEFSKWLYLQFEIEDITKVRYFHLIEFKNYLIGKALTDNSINIKIAAIKSFFKFLTLPLNESGESHIRNNVAVHLKKQKSNPYANSQVFDKELYLRLISELKEDKTKELRDKIIFMFFGYTGLRKNEVCQLKVKSIFIDRETPYYTTMGKGNQSITKELPESIFVLIQKWITLMSLKENDFLFFNLSNSMNGYDKSLSSSALNKILNVYTKKYGFSKTFRVHSLRSMSGIEVYEKTNDVLKVQRHLNHSTLNTTQIYLEKMENKKVSYYDKMFN